MKVNKLKFIFGILIILSVQLFIYGYNQPQQNQPDELSLVEFKKEINSNEYVLVYFNASWCTVCVKMKPIIEEIEKEYKTLKILRINTDENREISKEFEINSLPVLILYHNGIIAWTQYGVMTSSELKSKLYFLK